MRILILGANGRSGRLVTNEALKRGHTVTALIRQPASIDAADGLTIVQGTPLNDADVGKAFTADRKDPVQAVIVTLNAPRESDSPFAKPVVPPDFLRNCVRNAITAMKQHDVRKLVVMSAFGIGTSFQQLPWLMKLVFRYTNMKFQMEDHEAVDAEVREQDGIDWTLVRPAMLKEGGAAPVKELGEVGKGAGLTSGITRATVAGFLVTAAKQDTYSKRAIVIAN